MQIYSVNEKGAVAKLLKMEFTEDNAYIIEDENVIYVWFGLHVPLRTKYKYLQVARTLNKEKGENAKLLLMNQDHEYGGFLKIRETLEKEEDVEVLTEHRPVLELGKPIDDITLLKDFESRIRVEAYFIAQQNHTYNELCWLLAEKQIKILKEPDKPTAEEIEEKSKEVFNSFCTYDELAWLLAELTILEREHYD